jgi:hypothetical protein
MRGLPWVLGIGLCWTSVAFSSEGEAPGQAQAQAQQADDASELVCRREKVMGSNIKKKVCRTRAQIDQEQHASQEAMSEITRAPTRSEGS